LETILVHRGSNFWFGEKAGALAFALVLRHDAQNVWERSYPGKDTDAFTRPRLGGIVMEAALGRKRLVSLRYIQLAKVRTAARVGCPF
jgi:hypothetical protein